MSADGVCTSCGLFLRTIAEDVEEYVEHAPEDCIRGLRAELTAAKAALLVEQAAAMSIARIAVQGRARNPDAARIEPRFKESIDAWVETARRTGSFLDAVLRNDLAEAMKRGDPGALANLPHIAAYLYNDCPAMCWRSQTNVDRWIKLGGMAGRASDLNRATPTDRYSADQYIARASTPADRAVAEAHGYRHHAPCAMVHGGGVCTTPEICSKGETS